MASTNVAKAPQHESIPGMPVPSLWWSRWHALKGTNSRRLTIPDADLRNKRIILTGGNSWIGFEAALQFVKWGANIVLGCRQPPPHEMHPGPAVEKLKAAALASGHENTVIEWWEFDMSSLESVESFGKRWLGKDRPLDILVNNAATPPGELHFACSSHFDPAALVGKSPGTSNHLHYFMYAIDVTNANKGGVQSYPHNKLYFQTWLTELQARMLENDKYKHIVAHGVHPGHVQTNIWVPIQPQEETKSRKSWVDWLLNSLLQYLGIDAQQGSLAITNTATSPDWGLRQNTPSGDGKVGGDGARYANRIWDETPMPQTKHPECRRRIWDFVSKELKLEKRGLLTGLES